MMYGYNAADTALNQTLFVDYTIVNRAQVAYDSVKVGLQLDTDLDRTGDDYVGCDSSNNIMYSYNGDLFDDGAVNGNRGYVGYGNNTPAVGIKFISDPMDAYLRYGIGSGNNGGPDTPEGWLNYMNARWRNGQPMRYGGNGFNHGGVTNINTTHMFTGDPYALTGWTELTPGTGQQANPPGDRQMFGSMPYFSLQPNERKTIEIAVGFGRTTDTTSQVGQNIAELVRVLNSASRNNDSLVLPASTFATNDTCNAVTSLADNEFIELESLTIYPVPTSSTLRVESAATFNKIQLYDMRGTLVKRITPTQKEVAIDVSNLKEGIYLLNAFTERGMKSKKFMIVR